MAIVLIILVCINAGPTTVDYQRVEKTVQQFVCAKSGYPPEDVLVEFHSRPVKLVVPSEDYRLAVREDGVAHLRGHVSLPVEVTCRGRVVERLSLSCYVRTFGRICVVMRPLEKNEIIRPGDIVLQRVETTTLPEDVMLALPEPEERRTTRMIAVNSILTRSMVEGVPAVTHDRQVIVEVRSKNAVVTDAAIAKQDGAIGDIICVQRSGSHQRIWAKVIGDHRVQIILDGAPRPGATKQINKETAAQ